MNSTKTNVGQDGSINDKYSDGKSYCEESIKVISSETEHKKKKNKEDARKYDYDKISGAILMFVLTVLSLRGAYDAYLDPENLLDVIYGAAHLIIAAIFVVGGLLFFVEK